MPEDDNLIREGDMVRLPEWPLDEAAEVLQILPTAHGGFARLATCDPEGRYSSAWFLCPNLEKVVKGKAIPL